MKVTLYGSGPMRAAIYLRVSTTKQELGNQREQLEDYCEKSKYDVVEVYEDIISGNEEHRPGFDKMFVDAHKKKFDIVVFWAIDRFTRRGAPHAQMKLEELSNMSIQWTSYTEPYFNTMGPWKDAVLSIMATLAKLERERISDRTRAGIKWARNHGAQIGRPKVTLDHKIKLEIMKLKRDGYSIRRISTSLGCTQWSVRKTLHEMKGLLI